MATVTIPLATLTVGSHNFGPAAIADADRQVTLTVDRTVTNGAVQGFNGQPATTKASLELYQSGDGGATWVFLCAAGIVGGTYTDPDTGQPFTASEVEVTLNPGTGRLGRATVVVSGASVAVAGSLTTS